MRQIGWMRNSNKSFSPLKSELLPMLDHLFSHGEEVFKDMNTFREWFFTKSPMMNNKVAMALVCTCIGVDLVDEELYRIEYGYIV